MKNIYIYSALLLALFGNSCKKEEQKNQTYVINGEIVINKVEIFPEEEVKPLFDPRDAFKNDIVISCKDENDKEQTFHAEQLRKKPEFWFNDVNGSATVTDKNIEVIAIAYNGRDAVNGKYPLGLKPANLDQNNPEIVLEAYNKYMGYVSLEGANLDKISSVKVYPKGRDDIGVDLVMVSLEGSEEKSISGFLNTIHGAEWTIVFTFEEDDKPEMSQYDFMIEPNQYVVLDLEKIEGGKYQISPL